jgi:hypothetical protein
MSEFLDSVKADLLDRRMRPVLLLVGVAFLAALVFALLSSRSSGSNPAPPTSGPAPVGLSGISLRLVQPSPSEAVAETTSGFPHQSGGPSRNPFTPLAEPSKSSTSTTGGSNGSQSSSSSSGASVASAGSSSSGSSTSSSAGGQSGSGSSGSGASAPSSPPSSTGKPKPAAPPKPKIVYHVAVLFGTAPPGTPPESAHLTPYENLARQTPLPSADQPLVVFRGVTAGGKSATFTLVGEAILRGVGACLPSASRCQALDLKPGETEELEYLPASGPPVTYQLQVVGIRSSEASKATAHSASVGESHAGLLLLRRLGLVALPGLRYSENNDVLVFGTSPAHAARAHAARRHGKRGH